MANQHASGVNWRRSLDLAARTEVLRPLLEAGADKNAAGMSAASCLYVVVWKRYLPEAGFSENIRWFSKVKIAHPTAISSVGFGTVPIIFESPYPLLQMPTLF